MKKLLLKEEEDGDGRTREQSNADSSGSPAAIAARQETQGRSALDKLLAEKDAEIAFLKRKVASYEQQLATGPVPGGASATLSPGKVELRSPRSLRAEGRSRKQSSGVPEGSRGYPMAIDGSEEEDTFRSAGPGVAQRHSFPPSKKKVDLSDVIELTDSESDTEIVARSNVSAKSTKRRRKDSVKIKEEAAVKSEGDVLSETSRRKQRKLNYATGTSRDEKPETKPRVTEIPLEHDDGLRPAVDVVGKWKSETYKEEEKPQQTFRSGDATSPNDDPRSLASMPDPCAVRQLANPKAEVKKEFLLKEEDLLRLVAPTALLPHPISLPESQRSVTVTRDQLKERFGGNTMETFPRPSASRIAQHGYDNFMCINLTWNPHGPQIPGHGGLFFETTVWPGDPWTANPKHSPVQVLFTGLAQGKWLYLGEYELTGAAPLTLDQWNGMHEANRAIWPKEIAERNWGIPIRARIHLRRTLGSREPTREEVENAWGKFKNITVADIRAALDTGEESIQAWSMKCVGYDEDFQKEMVQLARRR